MPDPNTCVQKYGEKPGTKGYNDCLAYTGKYKYSHGGKLKEGGKIKNKNFKGKNRKSAVDFSAGGKYYRGGKLSQGGMLVGPSHENGGIPAIVDGNEPIEVEGGEFIINKQTVDSVGEDFLHKLNSTDTTHHTGGYNEGQLPSPSQFKDGGKVTRRDNMARGRRAPVRGRTGRAPAKRMARGGRTTGGRKMEHGGNHNCGGPGQMPCGGSMGGYRKGGQAGRKRMLRTGGRPAGGRPVNRTKPVRRMANGGMQGSSHLNTTVGACQMHSSDITSCNNHPGCHYDYGTERCIGR